MKYSVVFRPWILAAVTVLSSSPSWAAPQDEKQRLIEFLKSEIAKHEAEIQSKGSDLLRLGGEIQTHSNEKTRLEGESYRMGQEINALDYRRGQAQIALDRVKDRLDWEKDRETRWRLEQERSRLSDVIYTCQWEMKDLYYKRCDVESKIREHTSLKESKQAQLWSLEGEIGRLRREVGELRDRLQRLEHR